MEEKRKSDVVRRLAFVIAGLNVAMALVGVGFVVIATFSDVSELDVLLIYYAVYAVLATVIAILIITHQPRHKVGWLILFVGFFSALGPFDFGLYSLMKMGAFQPSYAVQGLIGVVVDLTWIPSLIIPLTLLLQIFPNGRLPSRLFSLFPVASLLSMVGLAAPFLFGPLISRVRSDFPNAYNPFAIPGSESILDAINSIVAPTIAAGFVGSLLILVVRFRRADAIERTQMKILFYTAVMGISVMLISPQFSNNPETALSSFLFLFLPTILVTSIGIAILRYRLFDIDIIIRRTLQYSIITGILAFIYFGLIVIAQTLFTAVGRQQSPIIIVISTLVIAVVFNPLRNRVQDTIDRRFYRRKYDAEQALTRFAVAARDEVDLERLAAELLEVVNETMQPERLGLTLFVDVEKAGNK